jgi:chromosome segregation ATPase
MGEGVIPPVRGSAIALTRLDDLLMQADISPDLLSELGRGLHKLGVSLSNMEAVGNVSEASQSYLETIQAADESLERLSRTYEEAITKVTEKTLFKYRGVAKSLSVIEKEASTYRDEMSNLTTMLGKLNTVYAQQRREENDYLRELVVAALESKKYRQQVAELNEHLALLNKHYAGMARELKTKRS